MKKNHLIPILCLGVFSLVACGNNPGTKPVTVTHWYDIADWWNYCSNGVTGEQAVTEDIGKEVNLTVNNQIHKVRLIGIDHDDLYNTSGKAHCTFEFSNLLSDSNGYSLAIFWNTDKGESSTNYDYLNSDIRKALDGKGSGTLRWYQKESSTMSIDYKKSVIEMLPNDLQNKIQTVKKQVTTTSSYDVKSYDAKVFALTYREMTKSSAPEAREEGTIYQYYKDHDNDRSRIKYQIRGRDGAIYNCGTNITDLNYSAYSGAGYNNPSDSCGGYYYLTSPGVNGSNNAWMIWDTGTPYIGYYPGFVYRYTFAVAPAFCI